ncbi:hypothetical protein SASPL_125663 [Salvia splendens]|uniref:Sec-independent protein translocase protein TatC n=1 Tax=Salvia splendens TaxID=180675 RepID=A0A8X8XJC0_SALSN|nr:hypothetical protein SASPL_125663 [Salvia splendens]
MILLPPPTMATALIYHPHLSRNMLDFKCSNSYFLSRTLKQTPPNPRSFSSRKLFKRFGRLSCSAVEDVTQKQQEISTTSNEASNDAEENPFLNNKLDDEGNSIYNILYASKELLPDDVEMSVYDHLEVLRQRIIVSVLAVGAAIVGCFAFSKDLILILKAPISAQVVSGYCGLLIGIPVILYEIIAFVLPGLTVAERRFLGSIVLDSSVLFYAGIAFSYLVLTPAALTFFVSYSEGAVESLWSIDQYFEFVLVLMFSTGLSFQGFLILLCQFAMFVPVIQLLLGQLGLVSSAQMLSIWRYVVVGSVVAAAVLTPSTDPLTQMLLAGPLMGLYLGGATMVKVIGR